MWVWRLPICILSAPVIMANNRADGAVDNVGTWARMLGYVQPTCRCWEAGVGKQAQKLWLCHMPVVQAGWLLGGVLR